MNTGRALMDTIKLHKISNDLYHFIFFFNRKIFHSDEVMKQFPLPPSHVKLIIYLKHHGPTYITEAATHLTISKPNMTPIIDKLLADELIQRYADASDRRKTLIALTDKAHVFLEEQENKIKDVLAEKLSAFSEEDLEALSTHLEGITQIMMKIQ